MPYSRKTRVLFSAVLSVATPTFVSTLPVDAATVLAQAQPETDHDKKPGERRPEPPRPQEQKGQPAPVPRQQAQPPVQQRQVQPSPQPEPHPGVPQQRQAQPPQVPPARQQQGGVPAEEHKGAPPSPPQQRTVQPAAPQAPPQQEPHPAVPQQRQVQPPQVPTARQQAQPEHNGAPASPRQEKTVQPTAPQAPQPTPLQRQAQPPASPGTQPPAQRGAGPSGPPHGPVAGGLPPPPRPSAPQQPLAKPAIAPTALQPPAPPPGSPAAQARAAFVPPPAHDNARRLDDVRGERHEVREGNRLIIQEPGRVIIREGGRTIVRHSETDRFRWGARDVHVERRGADIETVFERPDGIRIYTVTDESGRLLRRYRRGTDGREAIIINNIYSGPPRPAGFFVELPAPVINIPRERYIVDVQRAQPDDIYYALWAGPVERIERPYTLDEIRYSHTLRERMPRVDLDTITFDTGSWEVIPDQVESLAIIADGINRAIAANPSEVFLIEGHTDAVGSNVDNLSLSDRRAESVALVLSQQFAVPAENLTTQGYGEQDLKIPTQGPERANRRVTVRRITPLLTAQNAQVLQPPQ